MPVISASLFCICVKNSFPPLEIFLNSSKLSETPVFINPPLTTVAGACSDKVLKMAFLLVSQVAKSLLMCCK